MSPSCRTRPMLLAATLVHGGERDRSPPAFLSLSGGADGVRASKAEHSVERLDGDLGFDLLGRPGLGAQGVADHALVSTHRRLRLGPLIVAGGLLPAHAAALGDGLQMTIALRRIGVR